MLRLLCIAALAAASLAAKVKQPQNVKECKANLDEALIDVTATVDDRCEALVAFSKCISAFPSDDEAETLLFERNLKACESKWQETGSPEVRTRRGNLEMTVDDAKDVTFYRHRRETINVFTMHETLGRLVSKVESVTKQLADTEAELAKTKDQVVVQVAADLKKLTDETSKQLKAADDKVEEVKSSISSVKSGVDTSVKSLTDKVAKDLSDATKARNTALTGLTKKVDDANKKAKEDVDKAVGGVAEKLNDRPVFMWSGGARNHARGSGWRTFIMDRIEYDNAEPYFKRISNEKFKVLKSGLYHYDIDYMSYASSNCWGHFQFFVNGQALNGNNHLYVQSWRQMQYRVTWYMKAGQEFWSRAYIANCGNPYQWHSGGNWKNSYNRIQVTYVGQFGKADNNKCTSQYGLC